ncbi:galactokinase [Halarsenatibacter silvermanii]|uniref:Galactokinase n=1 Tax=Halarsenatibacter silvermanii TaxID=321763 RepID=A0A1G9GV83_9FIRM|nr:galactokinase [Halarsenatibacter silvermanii]SDL04183.1 galactokinase [Halarsenatibacter silvermanii]
MPDRLENLADIMKTVFADKKSRADSALKYFRAPGRVNLIGGHTDYNDGFVLPVAIDREIVLAAELRSDKKVRAYSCNFAEQASFQLDDIAYDEEVNWINYIQGIAYFLQEAGYRLQGMDAVIAGDVPVGAGLSSSAALEVSTAVTFSRLNRLDIDRISLARICRRAENEFVGVKCGIMDQFISALGRKNSAMFLDCRTEEFELLPAAGEDFKIVVADTGVEHNLASSAYNKRQQQCQEAVRYFDRWLEKPVKALRDINPAELAEHREKLPEIIERRCRHVLEENERVRECLQALKAGQIKRAGKLITLSHESLRDLYEVSCEELDLMVELALEVEGTMGARMTGAGFGGGTVNLVKKEVIEEFREFVGSGYRQKTGIDPDIYVCDIVEGAGELQK